MKVKVKMVRRKSAPVVAEQMKRNNISFLLNERRKSKTFTSEEIDNYCKSNHLMQIPLELFQEIFTDNLLVENGKPFLLVPHLWLLNWL